MKHRCAALVIGINNYEHNKNLNNAVNDATAIAEHLQKLNYEVTLSTDTKFDDFTKCFDNLCDHAHDYTVIVIYFAGHGMMANASDCIVFSDAEDMNKLDGMSALHKSFRIEKIYQDIRYFSDAIVVVIVDACRVDTDNGTRGVGKSLPFGKNTQLPYQTFIAFSTSPGKPAKDGTDGHSPFAKALIEELPVENQAIESTFKNVRRKVYKNVGDQLPWDHSCLVDDFCFNHGQLNPHYKGRYSIETYNIASHNDFQKSDEWKLATGLYENRDLETVNKIITIVSTFDQDNQFLFGKFLIEKCITDPTLIQVLTIPFFKKFQYKEENHVLNGFLYGYYVDLNENIRTYYRIDNKLIDLIGRISTIKEFKSSLNFLKEELSSFTEFLTYVVSIEDCKVYLQLSKTNNYCSDNLLFIIEDIEINDNYGLLFFDRSVYTSETLTEELQKKLGIPASRQRIISSPKIDRQTVLLTKDIDVEDLLRDYIVFNNLDSLDELGNHYELCEIYNVEIENAETDEEYLLLSGTFQVSAIVYLDSEEEIRNDVSLDASFKIEVGDENKSWEIVSDPEITVDTGSYWK